MSAKQNTRISTDENSLVRLLAQTWVNPIYRLLSRATPQQTKISRKIIAVLNEKYGHWLSFKLKEPVDFAGEPIPWYTYPAIEYLNQMDFSNKTVFEWGAGNSSIYWAKYASSVTSVEDNPIWFNKIKQKCTVLPHIILEQDKEKYIHAIGTGKPSYDVIIIDGSHRYECAQIAPKYLSKGGLIILDNSDWLPDSSQLLRETGLLQVDFSGFAPIDFFTHTTSLFFDREYNFSLRGTRQPQPSVGGMIITDFEHKSNQ